jgi:hypothetical protein
MNPNYGRGVFLNGNMAIVLVMKKAGFEWLKLGLSVRDGLGVRSPPCCRLSNTK